MAEVEASTACIKNRWSKGIFQDCWDVLLENSAPHLAFFPVWGAYGSLVVPSGPLAVRRRRAGGRSVRPSMVRKSSFGGFSSAAIGPIGAPREALAGLCIAASARRRVPSTPQLKALRMRERGRCDGARRVAVRGSTLSCTWRLRRTAKRACVARSEFERCWEKRRVARAAKFGRLQLREKPEN